MNPRELYDYQMKNILEAKTLLVARAAQKAYQRVGEGSPIEKYREALQGEFERGHIKFQAGGPPQSLSLEKFKQEYLCFGSLLVEASDEEITDEDCDKLKHHLAHSNIPVALIINWGRQGLLMKRILP